MAANRIHFRAIRQHIFGQISDHFYITSRKSIFMIKIERSVLFNRFFSSKKWRTSWTSFYVLLAKACFLFRELCPHFN